MKHPKRTPLVIVLIVCLTTAISAFQAKPGVRSSDIAFTVFLRGSTGEYLLQQCGAIERVDSVRGVASSAQDAVAYSYCIGFISGLLDIDRVESAALKMSTRYCAPDTVSGTQLARVVAKYLSDHPEQLHLPAVTLVGLAIKAGFPC